MSKTFNLNYLRVFIFACGILFAAATLLPNLSLAQQATTAKLEKMPPDLERDFALSSLPPHLRDGASVYLLDPAKGYYLAKKGTNGFVCFIARTEWEWNNFPTDYAMPMAYDIEGTKTIFKVYQDVAMMRASGKYTPQQVRDIVIDRIKKGIYKAPSKPGISYMLAPVMRGYMGDPGDNHVMTMNGPHYMFYAPYMDDKDIGGMIGKGPFVGNPGNNVLGPKKGPFGFIIVPAGKKEKADILQANSGLVKRLGSYKSYFRLTPAM